MTNLGTSSREVVMVDMEDISDDSDSPLSVGVAGGSSAVMRVARLLNSSTLSTEDDASPRSSSTSPPSSPPRADGGHTTQSSTPSRSRGAKKRGAESSSGVLGLNVGFKKKKKTTQRLLLGEQESKLIVGDKANTTSFTSAVPFTHSIPSTSASSSAPTSPLRPDADIRRRPVPLVASWQGEEALPVNEVAVPRSLTFDQLISLLRTSFVDRSPLFVTDLKRELVTERTWLDIAGEVADLMVFDSPDLRPHRAVRPVGGVISSVPHPKAVIHASDFLKALADGHPAAVYAECEFIDNSWAAIQAVYRRLAADGRAHNYRGRISVRIVERTDQYAASQQMLVIIRDNGCGMNMRRLQAMATMADAPREYGVQRDLTAVQEDHTSYYVNQSISEYGIGSNHAASFLADAMYVSTYEGKPDSQVLELVWSREDMLRRHEETGNGFADEAHSRLKGRTDWCLWRKHADNCAELHDELALENTTPDDASFTLVVLSISLGATQSRTSVAGEVLAMLRDERLVADTLADIYSRVLHGPLRNGQSLYPLPVITVQYLRKGVKGKLIDLSTVTSNDQSLIWQAHLRHLPSTDTSPQQPGELRLALQLGAPGLDGQQVVSCMLPFEMVYCPRRSDGETHPLLRRAHELEQARLEEKRAQLSGPERLTVTLSEDDDQDRVVLEQSRYLRSPDNHYDHLWHGRFIPLAKADTLHFFSHLAPEVRERMQVLLATGAPLNPDQVKLAMKTNLPHLINSKKDTEVWYFVMDAQSGKYVSKTAKVFKEIITTWATRASACDENYQFEDRHSHPQLTKAFGVPFYTAVQLGTNDAIKAGQLLKVQPDWFKGSDDKPERKERKEKGEEGSQRQPKADPKSTTSRRKGREGKVFFVRALAFSHSDVRRIQEGRATANDGDVLAYMEPWEVERPKVLHQYRAVCDPLKPQQGAAVQQLLGSMADSDRLQPPQRAQLLLQQVIRIPLRDVVKGLSTVGLQQQYTEYCLHIKRKAASTIRVFFTDDESGKAYHEDKTNDQLHPRLLTLGQIFPSSVVAAFNSEEPEPHAVSGEKVEQRFYRVVDEESVKSGRGRGSSASSSSSVIRIPRRTAASSGNGGSTSSRADAVESKERESVNEAMVGAFSTSTRLEPISKGFPAEVLAVTLASQLMEGRGKIRSQERGYQSFKLFSHPGRYVVEYKMKDKHTPGDRSEVPTLRHYVLVLPGRPADFTVAPQSASLATPGEMRLGQRGFSLRVDVKDAAGHAITPHNVQGAQGELCSFSLRVQHPRLTVSSKPGLQPSADRCHWLIEELMIEPIVRAAADSATAGPLVIEGLDLIAGGRVDLHVDFTVPGATVSAAATLHSTHFAVTLRSGEAVHALCTDFPAARELVNGSPLPSFTVQLVDKFGYATAVRSGQRAELKLLCSDVDLKDTWAANIAAQSLSERGFWASSSVRLPSLLIPPRRMAARFTSVGPVRAELQLQLQFPGHTTVRTCLLTLMPRSLPAFLTLYQQPHGLPIQEVQAGQLVHVTPGQSLSLFIRTVEETGQEWLIGADTTLSSSSTTVSSTPERAQSFRALLPPSLRSSAMVRVRGLVNSVNEQYEMALDDVSDSGLLPKLHVPNQPASHDQKLSCQIELLLGTERSEASLSQLQLHERPLVEYLHSRHPLLTAELTLAIKLVPYRWHADVIHTARCGEPLGDALRIHAIDRFGNRVDLPLDTPPPRITFSRPAEAAAAMEEDDDTAAVPHTFSVGEVVGKAASTGQGSGLEFFAPDAVVSGPVGDIVMTISDDRSALKSTQCLLPLHCGPVHRAELRLVSAQSNGGKLLTGLGEQPVLPAKLEFNSRTEGCQLAAVWLDQCGNRVDKVPDAMSTSLRLRVVNGCLYKVQTQALHALPHVGATVIGSDGVSLFPEFILSYARDQEAPSPEMALVLECFKDRVRRQATMLKLCQLPVGTCPVPYSVQSLDVHLKLEREAFDAAQVGRLVKSDVVQRMMEESSTLVLNGNRAPEVRVYLTLHPDQSTLQSSQLNAPEPPALRLNCSIDGEEHDGVYGEAKYDDVDGCYVFAPLDGDAGRMWRCGVWSFIVTHDELRDALLDLQLDQVSQSLLPAVQVLSGAPTELRVRAAKKNQLVCAAPDGDGVIAEDVRLFFVDAHGNPVLPSTLSDVLVNATRQAQCSVHAVDVDEDEKSVPVAPLPAAIPRTPPVISVQKMRLDGDEQWPVLPKINIPDDSEAKVQPDNGWYALRISLLQEQPNFLPFELLFKYVDNGQEKRLFEEKLRRERNQMDQVKAAIARISADIQALKAQREALDQRQVAVINNEAKARVDLIELVHSAALPTLRLQELEEFGQRVMAWRTAPEQRLPGAATPAVHPYHELARWLTVPEAQLQRQQQRDLPAVMRRPLVPLPVGQHGYHGSLASFPGAPTEPTARLVSWFFSSGFSHHLFDHYDGTGWRIMQEAAERDNTAIDLLAVDGLPDADLNRHPLPHELLTYPAERAQAAARGRPRYVMDELSFEAKDDAERDIQRRAIQVIVGRAMLMDCMADAKAYRELIGRHNNRVRTAANNRHQGNGRIIHVPAILCLQEMKVLSHIGGERHGPGSSVPNDAPNYHLTPRIAVRHVEERRLLEALLLVKRALLESAVSAERLCQDRRTADLNAREARLLAELRKANEDKNALDETHRRRGIQRAHDTLNQDARKPAVVSVPRVTRSSRRVHFPDDEDERGGRVRT